MRDTGDHARRPLREAICRHWYGRRLETCPGQKLPGEASPRLKLTASFWHSPTQRGQVDIVEFIWLAFLYGCIGNPSTCHHFQKMHGYSPRGILTTPTRASRRDAQNPAIYLHVSSAKDLPGGVGVKPSRRMMALNA